MASHLLSYTSVLALIVSSVVPFSSWAVRTANEPILNDDNLASRPILATNEADVFKQFDRGGLSKKRQLASTLFEVATTDPDPEKRKRALLLLHTSPDPEIKRKGIEAKNLNKRERDPLPSSQTVISPPNSEANPSSEHSRHLPIILQSNNQSSLLLAPNNLPTAVFQEHQPKSKKLNLTLPALKKPINRNSVPTSQAEKIAGELGKNKVKGFKEGSPKVSAFYDKVSDNWITTQIKANALGKAKRDGLIQALRDKVRDPTRSSEMKIKWLHDLLESPSSDFKVLAFEILGHNLTLTKLLNPHYITETSVKGINNTQYISSIRQTCQAVVSQEGIRPNLKAAFLEVQCALGVTGLSPDEKLKLNQQIKEVLQDNYQVLYSYRVKYLLKKMGQWSTPEAFPEWLTFTKNMLKEMGVYFNKENFLSDLYPLLPLHLCSLAHFRGTPRELIMNEMRPRMSWLGPSALENFSKFLRVCRDDENESLDLRLKAHALFKSIKDDHAQEASAFEESQIRNTTFDVDVRYNFLEASLKRNKNDNLGYLLMKAVMDESLDGALRLKCVENLGIIGDLHSDSNLKISCEDKYRAIQAILDDSNFTAVQRFRAMRLLFSSFGTLLHEFHLSAADHSSLKKAMEKLRNEFDEILLFLNNLGKNKDDHIKEEDVLKAAKIYEGFPTSKSDQIAETETMLDSPTFFHYSTHNTLIAELHGLFKDIKFRLVQVFIRHSTLPEKQRAECGRYIFEHQSLSDESKRETAEYLIDQHPECLGESRRVCAHALWILFEAGDAYKQKLINFLNTRILADVIPIEVFREVFRFVFNSNDKDVQLTLATQIKAKEIVKLLDQVNIEAWFGSTIPEVAQLAFDACFEYLTTHSFDDLGFKKLINKLWMFKVPALQNEAQERLYQFILREADEMKKEEWIGFLIPLSDLHINVLMRVFMTETFSSKLRMSIYKMIMEKASKSLLDTIKDENTRKIFCSQNILLSLIRAQFLDVALRWDIYEYEYHRLCRGSPYNRQADLNIEIFNIHDFSIQQRLTSLKRLVDGRPNDLSDESIQKFTQEADEYIQEIIELAQKIMESKSDHSLIGAKLLYHLALQQKISKEEARTLAKKTLGEYSDSKWRWDNFSLPKKIQALGYKLMSEIFEQSKKETNKENLVNCANDILGMIRQTKEKSLKDHLQPHESLARDILVTYQGGEIIRGKHWSEGTDFFNSVVKPQLKIAEYRLNTINFLKSIIVDSSITKDIRFEAFSCLATLSDEDVGSFLAENLKVLIPNEQENIKVVYPLEFVEQLVQSPSSQLQDVGLKIILDHMNELLVDDAQIKKYIQVLCKLTDQTLILKAADALAQFCRVYSASDFSSKCFAVLMDDSYHIGGNIICRRSEFRLRFFEQALKQKVVNAEQIFSIVSYFLADPSDIKKITDPVVHCELAKGLILYSCKNESKGALELALTSVPQDRWSEAFSPLWQKIAEGNFKARRSFEALIEAIGVRSDKRQAFQTLLGLARCQGINQEFFKKIGSALQNLYEADHSFLSDYKKILYENTVPHELKIHVAKILIAAHRSDETEFEAGVYVLQHFATNSAEVPHIRVQSISILLNIRHINDDIRNAHFDLLQIFHQNVEDLRTLVNLALNNGNYSENHQVYQQAIYVRNRLQPGNSYDAYQALLHTVGLPSTAKPLIEENNGQLVTLHPRYQKLKPLPEGGQKVTCSDFENLAKQIFIEGDQSDSIKIQIIKNWGSYDKKNTLEQNLSFYPSIKTRILSYVQEKQFFKDLLDDTKADMKADSSAIQLRELISYFKRLSTDCSAGLSDSSSSTLAFLRDIMSCNTGNRNGIMNSYLSMQLSRGIELNDNNNFRKMDDDTLRQKRALDLFRLVFDTFYDRIREAVLDPDQSGTVVRRLLRVGPTEIIREPSHQRLHVRNLIGNMIGAFYVGEKPAFDPHIKQCVEKTLLHADKDYVAEAYFKETAPSKLIGLWLREINEKIREEHNKPSIDHVYLPAAAAILGASEGSWDEDDDGNFLLTASGLTRIMIMADIFEAH